MKCLVRPECARLLGLVTALALGHSAWGQIYGPLPYGVKSGAEATSPSFFGPLGKPLNSAGVTGAWGVDVPAQHVWVVPTSDGLGKSDGDSANASSAPATSAWWQVAAPFGPPHYGATEAQSLTKAAGTLNLFGSNTYTGGTFVQNGTLCLEGTTLPGGTISLGGTTLLETTPPTNQTITHGGGVLQLQSGGTQLNGGTLAVSGTNNGEGFITEDGTGGTTVSNGTLIIAPSQPAPITSSGEGQLNTGSIVSENTDNWSIGCTLVVGNPSAFASLGYPGVLTLDGSSSDIALNSSNTIVDGASLTVANSAGLVSVPASVTASAVPAISPVPEPGTLALVVLAAAAVLPSRLRGKKGAKPNSLRGGAGS